MKINKQLFEDVLSDKLKGTFVTRAGWKIDSDMICRNTNDYYPPEHEKDCYPYMQVNNRAKTYTISDRINEFYTCHFDIVDFIPDKNMKENELTIEIPDGKIVDWDKSKKQNKIVFRNKQLTYDDIIENAEIGSLGIHYLSDDQMRGLLAKNQLANVAKYLNNGWKPKSGDIVTGLILEGKDRNIIFPVYCLDIDKCYFPQFVFKTEKLARQAIEILGEETVKLALEPLGI